jgi:hypothetical protein
MWCELTSPATGRPIKDLASVFNILSHHVASRFRDYPPPTFFKFELPWSESPALCRLLADEGATAAQMFPNYDGVVRSLKEQSVWDRVPYQAGSARDGVFE